MADENQKLKRGLVEKEEPRFPKAPPFRRCPKCNSEMLIGETFIKQRITDEIIGYAGDTPREVYWQNKTKGNWRYPKFITTYACPECGYLESYIEG